MVASPRQRTVHYPCTRSSKIQRLATRIPSVQPRVVSWGILPPDALSVQKGDQFAFAEVLMFGHGFNSRISGVAWPKSLKKITFGSHFDRSIGGVVWPSSLQHLVFGDM
ncbi:unnamed protein product, partial [Sphacelaria rigidula]